MAAVLLGAVMPTPAGVGQKGADAGSLRSVGYLSKMWERENGKEACVLLD